MEIDLLPFVPNVINGNKVLVEENDGFLKIWYKHPRVVPITIKRFVDPKILGGLLGQYQAEGTKDSKYNWRVEFTNKNILEHKEFVKGLGHLGIYKERLVFECDYRIGYDPSGKIKEFESLVGPVTIIQESKKMKGEYGFRTLMRSTVFTAVFLNILDISRKEMTKELTSLTDSFFAKLLSGDGTLDIRTKNREYGYPYIRIKIVDRQLEYLKDYAKTMKILGFTPHIQEKRISVRSGCKLENLLYLYKIRAFENGNNWNKLLLGIAFYLNGMHHNTYFRFIELVKHDSFTSKEYMKFFRVENMRTANDWLTNQEKRGLLTGNRKHSHGLVTWKLTHKARELIDILSKWKNEFDIFMKLWKISDLYEINEALKIKKYKNKFDYPTQLEN